MQLDTNLFKQINDWKQLSPYRTIPNLTTLGKKALENILGKAEIAGNQSYDFLSLKKKKKKCLNLRHISFSV